MTVCAVQAAADAVCDAEKARSIAVRLEQELAAATELIRLLREQVWLPSPCWRSCSRCREVAPLRAALTEWDERYGETA